MKEFVNLIESLVQLNNIALIFVMCFVFIFYVGWKSGLIDSIKGLFTTKEALTTINDNVVEVKDTVEVVKHDVGDMKEDNLRFDNDVNGLNQKIKELDNKVNMLNDSLSNIFNEIEDVRDTFAEDKIDNHRRQDENTKTLNDINLKMERMLTLVENINTNNNRHSYSNMNYGSNPNR